MRRAISTSASISASIAILVTAVSISAQDKDKYAVKVPNGLGFAEFRGYEDWAVISFSINGDKYAVIMGNPAMIDAFRQGIPD
ncbi:MAG: cytochrome P460, partial [Alphaproteobacteria bacterium]|nr:cytochrome P460 [Alphaproteobacteria bacterium]